MLPAMTDSDQQHPRGEPNPDHWRELVARLGADIAGPLTAAIERVHALATTGRIDRHNLRVLRDELEAARQFGIIGQQLARFGSGRLRQSHERMHLTQTLKGVLAHRAREIRARGIELTQLLRPIEVIADASLLFGLLTGMLDWALANAHGSIELRIDVKPSPAQARLTCRFARRPDVMHRGDAPSVSLSAGLDSLTWQLVQQTAWTMGLTVERIDESDQTTLTLDFPRTVNDQEGVSTTELDQGFSPSTHAKPLAGHQVLVVASRRDVRAQVVEALRSTGLIIDVVPSIAEAAQFCHDGLPHAIVYESALGGERFEQLRDDLLAEAPELAFIEIAEEGNDFEISSFTGAHATRVGRDAIVASLPSALMFELSKGL
jgi:hypothetical protein